MKGQGRRKIIEEGKKRRERAGRKEKMRRLENEERRYSYKERKSVEGLLGERRQAEGDREDEMNEGEVQRERRVSDKQQRESQRGTRRKGKDERLSPSRLLLCSPFESCFFFGEKKKY